MKVSVWQGENTRYPRIAPFYPSESYPEAFFPEIGSEANPVYSGLRQLFRLQGLDSIHYGEARWNPLGDIIRPGDRVLLKPNLIKEKHPRHPDGWMAMLTHGSVIRAVADYVFKAIGNQGRIIVADAPQTDSSFSKICRVLQLAELQAFYHAKGVDFRLVDLRKSEWLEVDDVIVSRKDLAGDPQGYVTVNLGKESLFYNHFGEGRYYGADYDTAEVNSHHRGEIHEYVISRSAIECDVFINLPKLKTHKKTGVTLSLKNLVGINGDKNYLPHYTEGTPAEGGDQFSDDTRLHEVESLGLRGLRKTALAIPVAGTWIYRQAKQLGGKILGKTSEVVRSGNWWGNDTCWRMCLDLNRIMLNTDTKGVLDLIDAKPRRRYISIIDGIVAGEGDGPIDVDPVEAGLLLMGTDPVSVDAVAATLMGCDPLKLPIIRNAAALKNLKISDVSFDNINVTSNRSDWHGKLTSFDRSTLMNFRPHFGWRGRIEMG